MKPADLMMNSNLQPIRPTPPAQGKTKPAPRGDVKQAVFSKVLSSELADRKKPGSAEAPGTLAFSAHAQARLQERNIALSAQNLQRLDHGVQLAEAKGSVNSLILMDDTAFIVSVKNKVVVTAISRHDAVDNVFTQIDSATIV